MSLTTVRTSLACGRLIALVLILAGGLLVFAPPIAAAQETTDEDAAAEQAEPAGADAEQDRPDEPATDGADAEDEAADEEKPDEAGTGEADADTEPGPWTVEKPCVNYQHPYQADLCQQWRTAEAAEKTATASERSAGLMRLIMLLGVISTLLLLLLFLPIIMAALAARRAATGAAPAVPSAMDRMDELRAYVDVDKIEFVETPESEGVIKVRIVFRNTGQTPAFSVKTATEIGTRDISDEDLLPVMPLPDRAVLESSWPRVGRDGTVTDIVQCESTPALADRVMAGDTTIVVWGVVEYVDVFDRTRKTAFQYLCNAETLDTGQMFRPMLRGDEGN